MKRRKSNKYIQINISTCFVFVPHPLPELCSMWGWRNRDNKVQDESNKPTVFSLYIVEENLTGKEGKRVNRPSVSNDRNDSNNFWALRRNRSQLSHISAQNLCGKKWLFPIEGMFGFSIPNECCAFLRGKKNFCWKDWLPANKHETQKRMKSPACVDECVPSHSHAVELWKKTGGGGESANDT